MQKFQFQVWFSMLLFFILTGCQSLPAPASAVSPRSAAIGSGRCPDVAPLTDKIVARSINVSRERLSALKVARSLTNSDICALPDEGLKRAFARLDKPKADHPGEWVEFRNLQRRSEDGKVKADGLIRGIEQRKKMLQRMIADASDSTMAPSSAGISADQWTGLGPGHVGGRVRTILVNPTDTTSIWAGSIAGGIWHSFDAGASWSPVNDFMGNLSISSLVLDPNTMTTLYAGTGEGFYNGDAVRGAGIFKSIDGGMTWDQLPATTPATSADWYYVNRIALKPGDGNLLLAATRGGIYRSPDAGSTWSKVWSTESLDVRFDPNNGNNAVAGGKNGLTFYSTDGGGSWTSVALASLDQLGRVEVAYAKSQPGVVFASVNKNNGEVWKSDDGGKNWTYLSNPQHLGSQGWYDNTIWVDPTDASHLVVGGIDLWRSIDGGTAWTRISNWANNMYEGYPDVPHADHHCLVSDPNYNGSTNKILYNGNDGGVFRAADISLASETAGWESLNHNLSITQFYSVAGHTAAGGKIIGGTQDNGSQMYTGSGTAWQLFNGGDGGFSAVDSQDDNYFYGEYVYLEMCRTTDRGAHVADIYTGITDAGKSATANFIAPFVLDPNDNNRMLAGGVSLWQSLAVKSSTPAWSAIKSSAGSKISAVAIAEGNSDLVWVGYNGGQVYRTSNGLSATPDWTQVGNGTLPARMVNRILIDRETPTTVYAALGGYNAKNLYRTIDNGLTWTDSTGNLPAVPIFTIVRHPTNASWLYAGTEVGLFTSQDGGTTWYTTNDGPANVEISELSWLDASNLLAATHGRGVFRARVNAGPDFTINASPVKITAIQGSSATTTITTTVLGGFGSAVSLSAHGLPAGATASFSPTSIAAAGSGSSTLTLTAGAATPVGVYTVTITGTGGGKTHTATISFTVTAAPPTFVINGGAIYTISPKVTLSLDSYPSAAMMQLNYTTRGWRKPETFIAAKVITLPKGDGEKTVVVRYLDANGVALVESSDSIILDTKAPTGTLTINGGARYTSDRTVVLNISATDITSGISGVCVKETNISCSDAEFVPFVATMDYILVSPGSGRKTVYATLRDKAGNRSRLLKAKIVLVAP